MATTLTWDLIARDKASDKFNAVGDSAEKAGGKFGKMAGAAKVGLAAVGVATVAAGTYFFNAAARLEQMGAKAETVFGSQLGTVEDWAKKSAHAMGLTKREATGLAANFGDLLIPMGFSRKKAAEMSTEVVGLSGALSQWSGGTKSAAEVSDILSAAMLGETDGLKSLGIAIGAADIQARIAKKGQEELTGAAMQQAEAVAIQELIFEKSTDAQKKFAEGGSPLLMAQAKLKASLGEVRDTIAVKLIPVFAKMATFLVDKVLPGASNLWSTLSTKLGPVLQDLGKWIGDDVLPVLRDLGDFIMDKLVPALAGAWMNALNGVRGMFENLGKGVKDNRPFIDALGQALKKVAEFAVAYVIPAIGKIYGVVLPALGVVISKTIGFTSALSTTLLGMARFGVKAFRFLLDAAFATFGGILAAADTGLGWIPGLGDKIGKAKRAFDSFREETVANLDKTANALQRTSDKIRGIKSKSITIDVKVRQTFTGPQILKGKGLNNGLSTPSGGLFNGLDDAGANGFMFGRGGRTLVGERGPEILDLPRGSRVHSNQATRSMGSDIDYRELAKCMVEALRTGLPIVQLPNAGQQAYLQGGF